MAQIQIAARISGTRDGVDWPAVGEIISVPDDEAADLIRLGFAKPVEKNSAVPVVEKAVARTPEKRTLTKESTGL
jgi:hypothetical protein